MRVAILTTGRFHVCDLARELDRLGHDVAFFSLVPPWRTKGFGLPDRCNRWLGPHLAPFMAAERLARATDASAATQEALGWALDQLAARVVSKCDVFVGMSGMTNETARAMQRKYRARVFIERGSRHILSQKEILERVPGKSRSMKPVSETTVRRELKAYELADTIVVPARHVVRSFVERGFSEARLFRNPYGASLEMFPPTEAPPPEPATIVMAGTWSLRKGCDVLARALQELPDAHLVHVGPLGDAEFPRADRFVHIPAVEQSRLAEVYARGHVLALASREEGLALVQPQALACGLRLVCTDRTGGEDLREVVAEPTAVTVVPTDDVVSLAAALRLSLQRAQCMRGRRDLLGDSRAALSWQAYGERYDTMLQERA